MSMHHSFDISIAEKFGVNVAIFLNNIAFWIIKNQANNKHFHDGRHWTYNSREAFTKIFPYWTVDQIKTIVQKCVEHDLIIKGDYNTNAYDRTNWYALSDKSCKLLNILTGENSPRDRAKVPNSLGENTQPIPDINTDNKPDKKASHLFNDKEPKDHYQESYRKYAKPKLVKNSAVEYSKKPLLPEYTGGGYKCAPNGEIPKDSPLYEFMQRNQQLDHKYARKVSDRVDIYG